MTESAQRLEYHVFYLGAVGDVGDHPYGLPAQGFNALDCVREASPTRGVAGVGVLRNVVQHHVGTLLGQSGGDGPPHATLAVGPRDQSYLTCKVVHAAPFPSARILGC